jgi:hypothetical protein
MIDYLHDNAVYLHEEAEDFDNDTICLKKKDSTEKG